MRRRITDFRLFFKQFLTNYHTTGAVMPSGRFLAKALARYVATGDGAKGDGANRRILEVGPGTGAVTRRIIAAMKPDDRLDLVELNDDFVERLRHAFETDPAFQPAADRARVMHCPVEDLPQDDSYDIIISGLPLNNFAVADVERILSALTGLLKPGGTLSFFQYIAIRRVKSLISGRAQRERLRGVGRAMGALLDAHEIHRDWVWPNVPPAWVHHVRPVP